ncbi:hypothetical protein ACFS1L_06765, partial [Streptomyces chumphonensis]
APGDRSRHPPGRRPRTVSAVSAPGEGPGPGAARPGGGSGNAGRVHGAPREAGSGKQAHQEPRRVTSFCDPELTITELRGVYETARDARLDPSNFHRNVPEAEGLLVPTGRRGAPRVAAPRRSTGRAPRRG